MSLTITIPETAFDTTPAAEHLRENCAAVRLTVRWWGTNRSLTPDQKADLCEGSSIDGSLFKASKQIIDSKHPQMRSLSKVKSQTINAWKQFSLPYVENGVRLMPRGYIPEFESNMRVYRRQLGVAVEELGGVYQSLLDGARERLGRFFNLRDYPEDLAGLFDIAWGYPSFEPPSYLMSLDQGLYRREQRRVTAQFDKAVALAETAFTEEFARLVSHLTERLGDSQDGEKKVFRDSALSNLREFFNRFQNLGLKSDQQLEDLVNQAQRLVRGINPQELRDISNLRKHIATGLSEVQNELAGMIVARPKRRIIRAAVEALA